MTQIFDRFSTIVRNHDNKFDIQLGNAHKAEDRFAHRLQRGTFELKTESYIWPRSGNIFIEANKVGDIPTGINVTEAEFWTHELVTENGETIAYIVMPTHLMKDVAKNHGKLVTGAGDGGRVNGYVLPLEKLVKIGRAHV